MNAKKAKFVRDSLLSSCVVTALLTSPSALAATDGEAAINAAMTKMEDRLLDHDYHKETDEQRLARLEKFVFGGPEEGTVQARVDRLKAAIVPAHSDATSSSVPPSAPSYTKAGSGNSAKNTTASSAGPTQTASSTAKSGQSYDPSDYGTYPRVAQLEEQFFGKSFASDALPVRVSRLETKEFGKPSPNEDLCCRMDRLDRIALKPTPSTPTAPASPSHALASGNSAPNLTPYGMNRSSAGFSDDSDAPAKPEIQNPFAPGSISIKGAEQRTTTLEKFVFGHEHIGKPLSERVAKLEKKLVPYEHNADKDIPTRIDHLWTMLDAANTMNNPPVSTD